MPNVFAAYSGSTEWAIIEHTMSFLCNFSGFRHCSLKFGGLRRMAVLQQVIFLVGNNRENEGIGGLFHRFWTFCTETRWAFTVWGPVFFKIVMGNIREHVVYFVVCGDIVTKFCREIIHNIINMSRHYAKFQSRRMNIHRVIESCNSLYQDEYFFCYCRYWHQFLSTWCPSHVTSCRKIWMKCDTQFSKYEKQKFLIHRSITILLMQIIAPNVVGMASVTCANLLQNFKNFQYILPKILTVNSAQYGRFNHFDVWTVWIVTLSYSTKRSAIFHNDVCA
jgi:hypothetical protein